VVPENIHTPPMEGLGISVPRGSLMTPLPPGSSSDLPWGRGYGYFLEPHNV